jgi:hypothetical protein
MENSSVPALSAAPVPRHASSPEIPEINKIPFLQACIGKGAVAAQETNKQESIWVVPIWVGGEILMPSPRGSHVKIGTSQPHLHVLASSVSTSKKEAPASLVMPCSVLPLVLACLFTGMVALQERACPAFDRHPAGGAAAQLAAAGPTHQVAAVEEHVPLALQANHAQRGLSGLGGGGLRCLISVPLYHLLTQRC